MQNNVLISAAQKSSASIPVHKQRFIHNLKPLNCRTTLRQTHIPKDEIILALLDRRRRKLEYKTAIVVEGLQNDIQNVIDTFIIQAKARTGSFAREIITGAEKFTTASFQEYFSTNELGLILIDIEKELQSKIKQHLNLIVKIDLVINDIMLQCHAEHNFIAGLVSQYRTTYAISKTAAKAADDACQKALSHAKLPWIIDRISRKIEFGSRGLALFNCNPRSEAIRCAGELEKCLNGVLDNIGLRIVAELKKRISDGIYNLVDTTVIAEISDMENLVKVNAIKRKSKHRRKHLVLVEAV